MPPMLQCGKVRATNVISFAKAKNAVSFECGLNANVGHRMCAQNVSSYGNLGNNFMIFAAIPFWNYNNSGFKVKRLPHRRYAHIVSLRCICWFVLNFLLLENWCLRLFYLCIQITSDGSAFLQQKNYAKQTANIFMMFVVAIISWKFLKTGKL